ncbi:MAG: hypothetical protein Q9192_001313 [Flavoplaca navasiana]
MRLNPIGLYYSAPPQPHPIHLLTSNPYESQHRIEYLTHSISSLNIFPKMPTFQSKKFVPKSFQNTFAASYRSSLSRHPFLLFGLPFIATMVAGSFFLTPAAALRYERHDRKIKTLSKDEELGLKRIEGRKAFDINEEYYRLAAKDLDDWDNKRVKRLKGEGDGVL